MPRADRLIVACLGAVRLGARRLDRGVDRVFGLTVTLVDFRFVLTHFSGGSPYEARLTGVGGSPGGASITALTHPLRIVDRVSNGRVCSTSGSSSHHSLSASDRPSCSQPPRNSRSSFSARRGDIALGSQNILPIVPFIFAGAVYALAKSRPAKMASRARTRYNIFVCSSSWARSIRTASLAFPPTRSGRESSGRAGTALGSGVRDEPPRSPPRRETLPIRVSCDRKSVLGSS